MVLTNFDPDIHISFGNSYESALPLIEKIQDIVLALLDSVLSGRSNADDLF